MIATFNRHVSTATAALVLAVAATMLTSLVTPAAAAADQAFPTAERLSGRTRIDTAIDVARSRFPGGADTVYLVGWGANADAAAAAALASDGPLLYVPRRGSPVTDETLQLIRDLGPERIIGFGGGDHITVDQIHQAAGAAGTDRKARFGNGLSVEERAVEIAERAMYRVPSRRASRILLVNSTALVDALVASPLLARPGSVMLYTSPDGRSLSAAARNFLDDHANSSTEFIAVGGSGVVTGSALNDAADRASSDNTRRLSGPTRYDTANAVAMDRMPDDYPDGPAVAYLVNNDATVDAAAVAPMATDGPILYVRDPDPRANDIEDLRDTSLPPSTRTVIQRLEPAAVVAIGGPDVVGDEALKAAAGASTGDGYLYDTAVFVMPHPDDESSVLSLVHRVRRPIFVVLSRGENASSCPDVIDQPQRSDGCKQARVDSYFRAQELMSRDGINVPRVGREEVSYFRDQDVTIRGDHVIFDFGDNKITTGRRREVQEAIVYAERMLGIPFETPVIGGAYTHPDRGHQGFFYTHRDHLGVTAALREFAPTELLSVGPVGSDIGFQFDSERDFKDLFATGEHQGSTTLYDDGRVGIWNQSDAYGWLHSPYWGVGTYSRGFTQHFETMP